MTKLKLASITGILLLSLAFPFLRVDAEDVSTVNPGFFTLDIEAGESREIVVNYYNAEDRDLRINYTLSSLAPEDSGDGYTLIPAPEFSNWVTWLSPEPRLVPANTAIDITFRVIVPENAISQSYIPVISLFPELPTGTTQNAQSNNYAISTVVYINSGSVLGAATTGGTVDILEFKPKYDFVFSTANSLKLNILNNSNYFHQLRGKVLIFRPNGSVSERFIPLNTETPLLKGESWLRNLVWDEDLSLIDKIKATGMYTAEIRLRIDDSYLYAQAKAQFLYIPFELIIIVSVLLTIVFSTLIYYRKRNPKLTNLNV